MKYFIHQFAGFGELNLCKRYISFKIAQPHNGMWGTCFTYRTQ